MSLATIGKMFVKIFGSRNERMLKAYHRRVMQINALEDDVRVLSDAQLRNKTQEFRKRVSDGEQTGDLMPEMLAVARETMDRAVGIRNIFNPEHSFDVEQLPSHLRLLYKQLSEQAAALGEEPVRGGTPAPGWMQIEIPTEIYGAVRELYPQSRPPFRARPFDVQLIGGMVLGEGRISEMKTGEGKTIVAPLACYVACVEQRQCHIVTVNDYLVQRDRDWVFLFYYWLGLTVGAIHPIVHSTFSQAHELKAEAYTCDALYGTKSEFGFDYLRDNMKLSVGEQVQKRREFCIIDEVDSILIDEARTPLIISGPAHDDAPRYGMADAVARHLMQQQRNWDRMNDKLVKAQMRLKGLEGDIRNARDKDKITNMRQEREQLEKSMPELEADRDQHTQYYEVELEKKAAHLTHEGVAEAQKNAGIGSFYVGNNMDVPHLLENALRAHVVYQRDKDYVVQDGDVVIVDEFTGRLMIGRQWSDGLHQAVESKERVKVKEETQTLATVTIQNFFKLYDRLAGMTGTAITEATEFHEIYKLDVVSIPTNVSVVRVDRNDLIFLSAKDKWNAIMDEIKQMHDVGRPVLVGTTSVEKSVELSDRLAKRFNINHEVLNAKQHLREAQIVEHAGELGAVMIATNMAGRGTDIKLRPIAREDLVRHWQQRNLLPRAAKPEMSDDELIRLAQRHMVQHDLGISKQDVADMSDDQVALEILRHWAQHHTWLEDDKVANMDADQCRAALDKVGGFYLHRLDIFDHTEALGGLHIIGTERHEARRIDNQLRGRSGRQGDQGSSRFFISLEDDLMQMFAGNTTMNALSKLGMKEGDAIEHRWITKSVERAQRKVEERNYEIRKNLLEYDEVMEYQRNTFYTLRQRVLEGRNVDQIIFEYIEDSVHDAVDKYLDKEYVPTQIAEWCRTALDISVEPGKLRVSELEDLHQQVRDEARVEAVQSIDVTIGEYTPTDVPAEEWDVRGLSQWAMSRFHVDMKHNQIRRMTIDEMKRTLIDAAHEQIDKKDLTGLARFLELNYGLRDLAEWCQQKFELKVDIDSLAEDPVEQVVEHLLEKSRQTYEQREVTYPADFAVEMTFHTAQVDGAAAVEQLVGWVNQRFGEQWTVADVGQMTPQSMHEKIVDQTDAWLRGDKLDREVDDAMRKHHDHESIIGWAKQRFGQDIDASQLNGEETTRNTLVATGRRMLRAELAQLERFVLLQILDIAWKDHLYAMDLLKDSIGLRGFGERDPRIEYKREGSEMFGQMQQTVRDRVTELIFRAKLTPQVEARSVYGDQEASHAEANLVTRAASAASRGTEQQRADQQAAEHAGAGDDDNRHMSRRQRRAAARNDRRKGGQERVKQRKRKR